MLPLPSQRDFQHDDIQNLREANSCIAWGAGLGALGVSTSLIAGTICPLCVVVAPALIGVGAWKRFAAGRTKKSAIKPEQGPGGRQEPC